VCELRSTCTTHCPPSSELSAKMTAPPVRMSRCPAWQPCRESNTTSTMRWPRLHQILRITILSRMGKMCSAYGATIGQAATTRLKSGLRGLHISPFRNQILPHAGFRTQIYSGFRTNRFEIGPFLYSKFCV
jgi:hypothetical protein